MTPDILSLITGLDKRKKLAFAYLACERLYPNYVFFHERFHFGDPGVLQAALLFLRTAIFSGPVNTSHIERLISDIEPNIPDTENFSTIHVSSALDACTALQNAMNFLRMSDDQLLNEISTAATDSVHMYIMERDEMDYNTEGLDLKVMNDALMLREIRIQNGIIAYLGKIGELEPADLDTLLQLQENDGKGNLGL